ncbi:MAG: sigma-70 family RNA polymerase sigma factor [Bacilli bacterium]|nr:sigma-70 family RNA polymerase sigma factor [Bacilli bacterium]
MQDKIYDEYYNKIYYWALGKTHNKEDAKDLLNDIFVEIFIYLNKNIKIEKLDNLIWTISYNTWKNKVRKIMKDKNIIYDDDIIDNTKYEEENIDKIIYEDIINNLEHYGLTDNEIKCFNLYYQEEKKVNEISKIMKTSESNIKYYLFNSRKKIKERYDD